MVARKPFRGTVEAQVLATGTGTLNIDACRIPAVGEHVHTMRSDPANRRGVVGGDMQAPSDADRNADAQAASIEKTNRLGRWPANVALVHHPDCTLVGERRIKSGAIARPYARARPNGTVYGTQTPIASATHHADADGTEAMEAWSCAPGCPVAELDRLSGELSSGDPTAVRAVGVRNAYGAESRTPGTPIVGYGDRGGASRFFFSGKASPLERDAGLDRPAEAGHRTVTPTSTVRNGRSAGHLVSDRKYSPPLVTNPHPTVKPIDLMRWLIRLVARPGSVVLDPFAGSGSTGCAAALEGVDFIGVESDPHFASIARARIAFWAGFPVGTTVAAVLGDEGPRRRTADEHLERRRQLAGAGQLDLLAGPEESHG